MAMHVFEIPSGSTGKRLFSAERPPSGTVHLTDIATPVRRDILAIEWELIPVAR